MENCGISRWECPGKINRKLRELTDQPIWEVSDDYYEGTILKYYEEKCQKSRAVFEEAQNYIPGGVQHNLAFNKPFPVCFNKADGAFLYDKDGNEYIDFLQAGGPTILGSNYPPIREAVKELLDECGPVTGLLHEAELLIAKQINHCMAQIVGRTVKVVPHTTKSIGKALRGSAAAMVKDGYVITCGRNLYEAYVAMRATRYRQTRWCWTAPLP